MKEEPSRATLAPPGGTAVPARRGGPHLSAFCPIQAAKQSFLGTAARAPEPTESLQFQKRWTHLEQNCSTKLESAQKDANRSPFGGAELVSGAKILNFLWQILDSMLTDRQTDRGQNAAAGPALARVILSTWAG